MEQKELDGSMKMSTPFISPKMNTQKSRRDELATKSIESMQSMQSELDESTQQKSPSKVFLRANDSTQKRKQYCEDQAQQQLYGSLNKFEMNQDNLRRQENSALTTEETFPNTVNGSNFNKAIKISNRVAPGYASMLSEEQTLKLKTNLQPKDDGQFRRTMDRLTQGLPAVKRYRQSSNGSGWLTTELSQMAPQRNPQVYTIRKNHPLKIIHNDKKQNFRTIDPPGRRMGRNHNLMQSHQLPISKLLHQSPGNTLHNASINTTLQKESIQTTTNKSAFIEPTQGSYMSQKPCSGTYQQINNLHNKAFLAPLSPHKPIDMTHSFPTTRISILRQKAAKGTSSHLEWEGRSQGFTNAFMGAMYTDQSLHTTSLKVERNRQRLEQLKEKEQQIHVKRDEFIKKQAIADLITEEFPRVKLPIQKVKIMSLFDICRIRERLRFMNLQNQSARIIQRCWARYKDNVVHGKQCLSLFEIKKMLDKVRFIQRQWIASRKRKVAQRTFNYLKRMATRIQRFMRSKQQMTCEDQRRKIHQNLAFFVPLRKKLRNDAQIKIAYHWRKYIQEAKANRLNSDLIVKKRRTPMKKKKTVAKGSSKGTKTNESMGKSFVTNSSDKNILNIVTKKPSQILRETVPTKSPQSSSHSVVKQKSFISLDSRKSGNIKSSSSNRQVSNMNVSLPKDDQESMRKLTPHSSSKSNRNEDEKETARMQKQSKSEFRKSGNEDAHLQYEEVASSEQTQIKSDNLMNKTFYSNAMDRTSPPQNWTLGIDEAKLEDEGESEVSVLESGFKVPEEDANRKRTSQDMVGGEEIEHTNELKTNSANKQMHKDPSVILKDDLAATVNNSVTENTRSYPQTADKDKDYVPGNLDQRTDDQDQPVFIQANNENDTQNDPLYMTDRTNQNSASNKRLQRSTELIQAPLHQDAQFSQNQNVQPAPENLNFGVNSSEEEERKVVTSNPSNSETSGPRSPTGQGKIREFDNPSSSQPVSDKDDNKNFDLAQDQSQEDSVYSSDHEEPSDEENGLAPPHGNI